MAELRGGLLHDLIEGGNAVAVEQLGKQLCQIRDVSLGNESMLRLFGGLDHCATKNRKRCERELRLEQ